MTKTTVALACALRTVSFRHRLGDVHVHLNGDRAMWGAGLNEHEALRKALALHGRPLGAGPDAAEAILSGAAPVAVERRGIGCEAAPKVFHILDDQLLASIGARPGLAGLPRDEERGHQAVRVPVGGRPELLVAAAQPQPAGKAQVSKAEERFNRQQANRKLDPELARLRAPYEAAVAAKGLRGLSVNVTADGKVQAWAYYGQQAVRGPIVSAGNPADKPQMHKRALDAFMDAVDERLAAIRKFANPTTFGRPFGGFAAQSGLEAHGHA